MDMNKTNVCKTAGLLVAACFGALAGSVLAAAPDPRQQVVNFADLDVSRPQGIAILYRRIESAAREVCGSVSERELSQAIRWHVCLDQAITRAVSGISIPALTSYHMVKAGRSDAVFFRPTAQRVAKQP
jgi:UrcA family protein